MRALVTGATGFIGRHLCEELVARDHSVIALVRSSSNTSVLPVEIETVVGDMTDRKSLERAVESVDTVIHLAALLRAPWRDDFITANAGGIENIAAACASASKKPRLVVVSSLAAAGPTLHGHIRTESDPPIPVSRYGRSKLAGERAARRFADEIELSVVRPPIVVGEYDHNSLPLFQAAARGVVASPTLGSSPVTVIHGRDLAIALILVAENGERAKSDVNDDQSGVYYAPGAAPLEMAELGRRIGAALNVSVRTLRVPQPALWMIAAATEAVGRLTDRPRFLSLDKYREATAGSWACSGAKLGQLGFVAAGLDDRLAQTITWYQQQGLL